MSLGSDSVGKGKILKISLADWIIGVPDEVKIGGEAVAMAEDNAATIDVNESTWYDSDGNKVAAAPTMDMLNATPAGELDIYVKVSGDVGLGSKTVVLFDGGSALAGARASVDITASDLTVSPSTAVVGREVTVTGSGFTGSVVMIEVGDATVCDSIENNNIADCDIETASGGRVVAAFNIPNHKSLADADDYSVMITDSSDRIGVGTVTIPEPTLTVDPAESRINSTINLSGAGWPTGTGANLVALEYDGVQYSSAITTPDGTWSASIVVPPAAGVGTTHKVEATANVGMGTDTKAVTMEGDHSTPDPVVTLSSAQAQRGTTITVSGDNFHTFQSVTIEIGGNPAATSATTDGVGSFSAEVVVPGLALGNKNLKVTVNKVPVVEFLEVVATPVVTTMTVEEAFADLIEDGTLNTVWRYDINAPAGSRWTSYTTDPETSIANDLFELDSGDILYINVTGEQSFSPPEGRHHPRRLEPDYP